MNNRALLAMTRPEKWFTSKSKMIIEGPGGTPIGQIAQETTGTLGATATIAHAGLSNVSTIALRIFPGPVPPDPTGGSRVAATWTPHPSLREDFHTYVDAHPMTGSPRPGRPWTVRAAGRADLRSDQCCSAG